MTKVGTRNAEPRRNSIRRPWRGIRRGWRLDRASEAVGSPLRADHDPRRGRDTRGNGMWGILRRGAERFMEAMGCMIAGVLHAEIEGIHPWTGRRGVRMVGILAGGGARMRRRWAVNGALLGVPVSVATLPARGPRGACLTPKSVQFSVAQEVPLPGTKSVQFLTPIDTRSGSCGPMPTRADASARYRLPSPDRSTRRRGAALEARRHARIKRCPSRQIETMPRTVVATERMPTRTGAQDVAMARPGAES